MSHDRFENAAPPEGWRPEKRTCPFCLVMHCGCPSEPDVVFVPPNIIRGDE